MDYETWLSYQEINTIEAPDEVNPYDDPYWEDQATIEEHLDHEAYLAERISHWLGMEVKL